MAKETKFNLINILVTIIIGSLATYFFNDVAKKLEKGEKAYEKIDNIAPTILHALDTLSLSNTYKFSQVFQKQEQFEAKQNKLLYCLKNKKIYIESYAPLKNNIKVDTTCNYNYTQVQKEKLNDLIENKKINNEIKIKDNFGNEKTLVRTGENRLNLNNN